MRAVEVLEIPVFESILTSKWCQTIFLGLYLVPVVSFQASWGLSVPTKMEAKPLAFQ